MTKRSPGKKRRETFQKKKTVKQNPSRKLLYFFGILLLCLAIIPLTVLHKHGLVKGRRITPFLTTNGTKLVSRDTPYTFVGFNMYNIASLPGHNAGCGGPVSDINSFFATLRPNSMVRMWAWQGSMAINPTTKQLDWTGIDRVLAAAKRYHQKLIISLGTQSGQCDDGQWKDSAWYQGGYRNVSDASGLTPLSYWEYIHQIVSRYKTSTVIGMWELINEPETSDCTGYSGTGCYGHQTCVDYAQAGVVLRQFFDTVGGDVKALDPSHLIESGVIGTGQCGSDNGNYTYIHQSPSIDVASYHDYNDDTSPMPGDQWNGLAVRLSQMKSIGKPLIIGEVGMVAFQGGGGCMTLDQRRDAMKAKMDAMFPAGIAGFIPWSRSPDLDTSCNYDIGNTDPLVTLVNAYRLP